MSFEDKKSIRGRYTGAIKKLSNLFYEFSLFERILVCIAGIILITSTISAILKINDHYLIEVPKEGGTLHEGMIGTPRFINPVLATSDTDRDLTSLIYSGLLRINSSGELIPDLAESYTVSEDGLSYYFKIRDDAVFHDGTPVTTDDIIFTILKTQDPTIKSPKRPNWDGVRVEKINEKEIQFSLNTPYSPFIYNATLGIIPKHKWDLISAEEFPFSSLNTNPIGSGPYQLEKIEKDENEISTRYKLKSFNNYVLRTPYISTILISFFKNEDDMIFAFNHNQIDSLHSISPSNISKLEISHEEIIDLPYSRIFALFFNQNKSPILANKEIRDALNTSVDREKLTDSILSGYATPLYTPLSIFNSPQATSTTSTTTDASEEVIEKSFGIDAGKEKVLDLGYTYNADGYATKETDLGTQTITFTIATSNVGELVSIGESLVETFKAIGVQTALEIYETNDLTSSVIRPRDFDAILFGNVINRDLDYYAFWHSSQRNDPGLNIASYTSIEADKILEESRSLINIDQKLSLLQNFEKEVINDVPAVFLYSPDFIYVTPQNLRAQFPQIIVTPSDRYFEVYNWYVETETVWKIFAK